MTLGNKKMVKVYTQIQIVFFPPKLVWDFLGALVGAFSIYNLLESFVGLFFHFLKVLLCGVFYNVISRLIILPMS